MREFHLARRRAASAIGSSQHCGLSKVPGFVLLAFRPARVRPAR
jgi:hypothetical protein